MSKYITLRDTDGAVSSAALAITDSASDVLRGNGTFGAAPAGEAFPVGSAFLSFVSTNPLVLLGYGVWTAVGAGRMLVGVDLLDPDFDAAEKTGGAKTHTLTTAEMPSHTHVETNNSATTGPLAGWSARDTSTNTPVATGYSTEATGGGGAHNNMPPFLAVHIWKRTA